MLCSGVDYQNLYEAEDDCGVCDLIFESSATPPTSCSYLLILNDENAEEIVSYSFLTDYKNLSFLLRGPPTL